MAAAALPNLTNFLSRQDFEKELRPDRCWDRFNSKIDAILEPMLAKVDPFFVTTSAKVLQVMLTIAGFIVAVINPTSNGTATTVTRLIIAFLVALLTYGVNRRTAKVYAFLTGRCDTLEKDIENLSDHVYDGD